MHNIVATGDWHIHIRSGVNKEWQISRYEELIDYFINYCRDNQCDLALLGDILDSISPKKEELKLFLHLLHRTLKENIKVYLVSGNHCTISENLSILDFLEVAKFPNVYYWDSITQPNGTIIHLINHDALNTYPKPDNVKGERHIAFTHVRPTVSKYIQEEIDVKAFASNFDLVIAADIHAPLEFDNVFYTNNPINSEFEASPNCGFIHLDLETLTIERIPLDTPALISKKMSPKELSKWLQTPQDQNYYKIECEGTPEELREFKSQYEFCRVEKIPVIPETLNVDINLEVPTECNSGMDKNFEVDIVGYMKSLNYSDDLIGDMMCEFKEVV